MQRRQIGGSPALLRIGGVLLPTSTFCLPYGVRGGGWQNEVPFWEVGAMGSVSEGALSNLTAKGNG